MFKKKKIQLEIYPYDVIFVVVDSIKSYEKLQYKYNLNNQFTLNSFKGLATENGLETGSALIIFNLPRLKNKREILSVLRHETHHIASFIFAFINERCKKLDTEPFMYLCDYLFEQGLDFLKEMKVL